MHICSILLALLAAGMARSAAADFVCAGPLQEGPAAKAALGYALPPPPSRLHAVVLFAQFPEEGRLPVPDYARGLFDPLLPGSFAHFYQTMSFGTMEVRGSVLSRRYVSTQPASAYLASRAGDRGRYGDFVVDVLRQVDREVDWRQYDDDGPDGVPDSGDDDGYVDHLFVNVVSAPRGFIRDGATGGAGLGFGSDFLSGDIGRNGQPIRISSKITHGSIQQEGNFSQTVGTMAHEYGHALGLPDLYDMVYGNPAEDSAGIGHWGLMGWGAHGWTGNDGPVAFSPWSLQQLGWIGAGNERLVEISGDTSLVVEDLREGGSIYLVRLGLGPGSREGAAAEYLLLEQRTRTYYNRSAPAEGLLVWHVRPQVTTNNEEGLKMVDLVCADGLFRDAGHPLGRQADVGRGSDNLDFWAHDEGHASRYGGNRGDATDAFDGVRYARLHLRGNPSSNLLGLQTAAFSGLDLRLRPQGRGMRVDLVQPRWSGTIREEVHWKGDVLVDGDLRVEPGGTLVVHRETRVFFAGADRLQGGRDRERVELAIAGNLSILAPAGSGSVLFAGGDAARSWYGVLIEPVGGSRIEMPEGTYRIRDAEKGILLPGAPEGALGRIDRAVRLYDAPGTETAGNGDGRLSPGESFRLEMAIDNWTLHWYRKVGARLRWNTPLVFAAWSAQAAQGNRVELAEELELYPGTRHNLSLPVLRLSPQAEPGQRVEFIFEVFNSGLALRDTLVLEVEGQYAVPGALLQVPGRSLRDGSALIESGWPTSLRALVGEGVEEVHLVVRSLSADRPVVALPMRRRGSQAGQQVFQAAFLPEGPDQYQAFLRLHHADGSVVFGQQSLYLWAHPRTSAPPVLVFLGRQYGSGVKERLHPLLAQELESLGLASHILDIAPEEAPLYGALLPHYAREERLVVWMGRRLDEQAQSAFRHFLESGGRLLLVSFEVSRSQNIDHFLQEVAHATRANSGRRWFRRSRSIYSVDPGRSVQFYALHSSIEPINPAEVILRNSQEEAAGLRVDTGAYRLVYLPFDLGNQREEIVRPLLRSGVRFLQGREPVPGPQEGTPAMPSVSSYPNPFNAQTTIAYALAGAGLVELTIYNIAGQSVRRLLAQVQGPGRHQVAWDGRDDGGRAVGSGVYFYALRAGPHAVKGRLLLLK